MLSTALDSCLPGFLQTIITLMSGAGVGIAFLESIIQRGGVSTPESPLLSIIIAAYKSRNEIGPCLASLPRTLTAHDGSVQPVEIIVVDNSPGDGTDECIRTD